MYLSRSRCPLPAAQGFPVTGLAVPQEAGSAEGAWPALPWPDRTRKGYGWILMSRGADARSVILSPGA